MAGDQAEEEKGTVPIPVPPGLPLVGNVLDLDSEFPLGSMFHLAEKYGEIYKLVIAGSPRVFVSSYRLANELCDESRFSKKVGTALEQVRNGVHDGLFTAYPGEHNWEVAHRILVPAFGPISIRNMFDEMHDIASQLVMKWARHGPDFVIPVTDDFTRLTLDTLALCAMDYRFNSYYKDELHPFIEAMGDFLSESGRRASRPPFANAFYRAAQLKYEADIELLRRTSDEVVRNRRAHPTDRKDLLNAMINGRDPKTGESLNDDTITNNMITFLIAGHETTSGLLSFVFYYLLQNPDAFQKAQAEVDRVVGAGRITVDHLSKLPYIAAILRETLRLNPTAPAIGLTPLEDTVIGGKYKVIKDEPIGLILGKIHTDPAVWGEDANQWKPERMLDENFNKLPPNAWKPFGNGMRACIGRPFAWQEALLVVALLLQNFNFIPEDPSYKLQLKQTLTIKPKGFYMRAISRAGRDPNRVAAPAAVAAADGVNGSAPAPTSKVADGGKKGKAMRVLYGGNTGTCEAFASRLASDAAGRGWDAKVDPLDAGKATLQKGEPVVIVTASYEGEPPDNARFFCKWLEGLEGEELDGVDYAVFGCGHHDWAQTFQKIPTLVDERMEARGGKKVCPRGSADAAEGDMFTDFETWEETVFWPAMDKLSGSEDSSKGSASVDTSVTVDISTPRASTLRQDVVEARVIRNELLTTPGYYPEKKHIEIELPSGSTYSAGDYLAVLPLNPPESVSRAMKQFSLSWDSTITISASGPSTLPVHTPIPAHDVFAAYVELAQPCTRRNLATLMAGAKDEATRSALRALAEEDYAAVVQAQRLSPLDLLERFRAGLAIPLGTFLGMLPPMRVRQYSISSSPLWNPSRVTLTYAVLAAPALSATESQQQQQQKPQQLPPQQLQPHRHLGVASTYLASLTAGDLVHVSVRQSHRAFHLPARPESTPIIMVAAGTGIAPFRGFVQERAAQRAAAPHRPLADALLFYGVRGVGGDDLHRAELEAWEREGVVQVYWAYSRRPPPPTPTAEDGGEGGEGQVKYVQDRLWRERAQVVRLWEQGAKVFVCGGRGVGDGVRAMCLRIAAEEARRLREEKRARGEEVEEVGEEEREARLRKWFEGVREERFASDVFN